MHAVNCIRKGKDIDINMSLTSLHSPPPPLYTIADGVHYPIISHGYYYHYKGNGKSSDSIVPLKILVHM